jgi:predicted heme/steroid binding protein/uncharacterized membrane protein
MKVFSPEDLVEADGKDGRSALVAIDGTVYDVSGSEKWANGVHMRRHQAGKNLTSEIEGAPHGREVLRRLDVAGTYEETPKSPFSRSRQLVGRWLDLHPFFRRHPHPSAVHIPIALLSTAPFFLIIAVVWKSGRTEWAAFCCAVTGLLAIPAAMATGYFTWWINYDMADSPIIRAKRHLAWIALVVGIASVLFRLLVVSDATAIGDLTAVLNLALAILLGIISALIGYLGGRLTFPYK